jgi:O-methyltransferase involved in polyketide biosynthesis
MDKVTTGGPFLIVAEGLTMYLAQDDMKQLLDRVVGRFSSGEVVFDALSTGALRARKRYLGITGAKLRWGIDDPHEIEIRNPRLRLIEEIPLVALLMLRGCRGRQGSCVGG